MNQSPPPIAGGKELPVPPAKKPMPNPPSKPLSKQPVVMAKVKLAKNGIFPAFDYFWNEPCPDTLREKVLDC